MAELSADGKDVTNRFMPSETRTEMVKAFAIFASVFEHSCESLVRANDCFTELLTLTDHSQSTTFTTRLKMLMQRYADSHERYMELLLMSAESLADLEETLMVTVEKYRAHFMPVLEYLHEASEQATIEAAHASQSATSAVYQARCELSKLESNKENRCHEEGLGP